MVSIGGNGSKGFGLPTIGSIYLIGCLHEYAAGSCRRLSCVLRWLPNRQSNLETYRGVDQMRYIFVITAVGTPRIFGTWSRLGELQRWVVNSQYRPDDLEVWRFIDGEPDGKVDKIQWNSGEVID